MKKFMILSILLTVFLLFPDDGDCVTYCSITRGHDINIYNGTVYTATDGGLIELSGESIKVYDTDDGISKPEICAVEKDSRGILWLGHPDASITLLDPQTGNTVYTDDIMVSGVYELNNIYSSEKYIYVAVSGLLARYRYNETYDKYDISDTNTMTGDVKDASVHRGNIYIASQTGVLTIDEDAQNISFIDNWTAVTGFDTGTETRSFFKVSDSLYALTDNGIYSVTEQTAEKLNIYRGSDLYYGLAYGDRVYISEQQVGATVIRSSPLSLTGNPEIVFGTEGEGSEIFAVNDGVLYFTSETGFSYIELSEPDTRYDMQLDLPAEKGIIRVKYTADRDRLLFMSPKIFSFLDTQTGSFHGTEYPAAYEGKNIFEAVSGNVFTGSWSTGVREFERTEEGYSFVKSHFLASYLSPQEDDYPFSVHPDIDQDSKGNIWITNFDHWENDPDPTLFRIDPQGIVTEFTTPGFSHPYNIYIDDDDFMWIGSCTQQFGELDGLGITAADNISVNRIIGVGGVTDVIKDNDDIVWIASNKGINYIDLKISPSPTALSSANVNKIISGPVSSLIYDIEISSSNEKWFATDKGISVLSSDNSSWRHYIPGYADAESAIPGRLKKVNMPDAEIFDIELDESNGRVIIASHSGLTFMESGGIVVKKNAEKGEIYTDPSPFLADGESGIRFVFADDGNVYNRAKIFDLTGRLVKGEFDISNGWNGRDNDNKIVSTGIYQIIAFNDKDRTINIKGKIAVVRK